jgi:hypothetical protein
LPPQAEESGGERWGQEASEKQEGKEKIEVKKKRNERIHKKTRRVTRTSRATALMRAGEVCCLGRSSCNNSKRESPLRLEASLKRADPALKSNNNDHSKELGAQF